VILLDTNHLSVLKYPENSRHPLLLQKMESSIDQDFAIPIVVVEEQLRGWLSVIPLREIVNGKLQPTLAWSV
jgi:hypothetical protein